MSAAIVTAGCIAGAVFGIIIGAVWYASEVIAWRRTTALVDSARRLGLRFAGDEPSKGPVLRAGFAHLSRSRPRVSNVLVGSAHGVSVKVFDFTYSEGPEILATDNAARTESCAIAQLPVSGPAIRLAREGRLTKYMRPLFGDQIRFDDAPFERRYRVSSKDRENTIRMLTGPLRSWLAEAPPDVNLEVMGRAVLACRERYTDMRTDIADVLEVAAGFAQRVATPDGNLDAPDDALFSAISVEPPRAPRFMDALRVTAIASVVLSAVFTVVLSLQRAFPV